MLLPGTRLGVYEVDSLLGHGGMGDVYRAFEARLGRSVAIKVLPTDLADNPSRLSRFEREARLLASLNHPNVATIYGFFSETPKPSETTPGDPPRSDPPTRPVPFLVMELVEGQTLANRLSQQVMSADEAIAFFRQVADGMEAAHELGIVHRDLKPANLMVASNGVAKILDFGIAKGSVAEADASSEEFPDVRTDTGISVGTPGYMSPEQTRGKQVDKRSDIWSYGCVLFEALCGRSPFAGDTQADRTAAMLTGSPDLSLLDHDLPAPLRQLIRRCLIVDPRERLRDIGEARVQLEALERHQQEGATVETGWQEADADWRTGAGRSIPGRPNWQLSEQLGVGGFGEVWLARHQKTGAARVFKFCFDDDRVLSLRREITLLRMLRQALGDRSDIAQLLDWQLDSQPAFLELEYSEGGDLVHYSRQLGGIQEMPMDQRLEIIAQTAVALAAAHSVGILHKDLKPTNILIGDRDTGLPRARLSDFGIGHLLDRGLLSSPGITIAGLTQTLLSPEPSGGGTPLYVAPEIYSGDLPTIQSDIYSLGVVLYQAVVGDFSRPLATGWERDISDSMLRDDIAACVDGSPDRRLRSAGELAERLRSLAERHEAERQEERRLARESLESERAEQEAKDFEQRRRRFLLIGLAGMALLLMVSMVAWRGNVRAAEEHALREEFRRRLYVSDMNLAGVAYSQGASQRLTALLDNHRPQPGQEDLRQWEWHHWWHATHLQSAGIFQSGGPISAPAVSPSRDLLATVDFFGRLRLYDRELTVMNAAATDSAPGGAVAFSPSGQLLATLARNGGVEIWDVEEALNTAPRLMRPTRTLADGPPSQLRGTVAFSPDGPVLASGLRSGTLTIWNTDTWELIGSVNTQGPVEGLVFGPEPGQVTLVESAGSREPSGFGEPSGYQSEPSMVIYDLQKMAAVARFPIPDLNPPATVPIARSASTGALLIAERGGVGLWNRNMTRESTLPTATAVHAVAFSPDGRRAAAGVALTADLVVWELDSLQSPRVLKGHEQQVIGVSFTPDSETVFSTGQDATVRRWDLATASRFDQLVDVHLWGSVAYSPDGRFVSVGGGQWPGKLSALRWDVDDRSALETPRLATGFVHYAVSEYGGAVVGMAADGQIHLGDLGTGAWRSIEGLEADEMTTVGPLNISSDGQLVAWDLTQKTPERRTVVLDTATGIRTTLPGSQPAGRGIEGSGGFPRREQPSFSPDGRQLVEHEFGQSTVWDLTTQPPSFMYSSKGWGQESCASFSPNGELLAICSQDNSIRLIAARTGEAIRVLKGHAGNPTSAAFSSDSRSLVSVGPDGTMRIWDVGTGQLRTTMTDMGEPAWRVAFSPRGDSIATVHGVPADGPGARGQLRVWRLGAEEGIRTDAAGERDPGEQTVDFAGIHVLRCQEGDTIDPTPFDLLLRLEQSGNQVSGESHSTTGFGSVAGSVEGNVLHYVLQTNGECEASLMGRLSVRDGLWTTEITGSDCRGEFTASCDGF